MNDILTQIVEKKKKEIEFLYETEGYEALKEKAFFMPKRRHFYSAISTPGLSLIAELKKASPSKGLINPDFDPVSLALQFEASGASCLSVLTETNYFLGHPNYIDRVKSHVSLPVLRKDFIVDPIQIFESKCLKADCILLIKALLSDEECQALINLATDFELDVLLEVHNEEEINSALAMENVTIIGINNRDLKTFSVDTQTVFRLAEIIRSKSESCRIVAESGYSTREELAQLNTARIDAVLIGEGLVKNPRLLTYFES